MTLKKRVPVQDQAREQLIIKLFGLSPNPERLGPDAFDNDNNPYELKSTTMSGIGTGRDVSLSMLNNWRKRYWLVAKGENLEDGFHPDEIYFLSPNMIEGRLKEIEEKIRPDLELRDTVLDLLNEDLSQNELDQVDYLMSRGATLNNPKISWLYIQENGVQIQGDYIKTLRELVTKYPLTSKE